MNIATARRRDSEEEESESVEQGPWKPLKKGRCVWLDVEQDIRERRSETAEQREVRLALRRERYRERMNNGMNLKWACTNGNS